MPRRERSALILPGSTQQKVSGTAVSSGSAFSCRKGIFVRSELEDFELLLQRLSCLGGVLQNPHPVPKYSTATGLDFHGQFVLHCLEHSLHYLLYTYLDYYR